MKGGDYVKQKTIEKIILLFDNGKIVYSKLHRKFPALSNDELLSLMGYLSENTCLFTLSRNVSADDIKRYGFKEDDVFTLTEDGENIFYRLQQEQHALRLSESSVGIAEKSLKEAKKATKIAIIAIVLSATLSLLSILLSLLSILPH